MFGICFTSRKKQYTISITDFTTGESKNQEFFETIYILNFMVYFVNNFEKVDK